ncbi:MAG TPA: hypothetical protein DCX60_03100 [Phycisphaerales bacterium]|nr:hypothetical protein [Phycisphaerales bacterium]
MKKPIAALLSSTLLSICFTLLVLGAIGWVLGDLGGTPPTDVTLSFDQGHGVRVGAQVRCRGIAVGRVSAVRLEGEGVRVEVSLESESRSFLMREGTRWWIDRPVVEWSGVGGLDGAFKDRVVEVDPGPSDGPIVADFRGLDAPPVLSHHQPGDLELVLMASRRGSLQRGAAVLYRGIRIGTILDTTLAEDATSIEARILIERRYAPLVRDNSRFHEAGAFDLDLGFSGLRARLDSLETLMVGGVSLVTPDAPGERVTSGARFEVDPEERDEWAEWRPRIPLED